MTDRHMVIPGGSLLPDQDARFASEMRAAFKERPMPATVLHLRDYQPKPKDRPRPETPAQVVVMPVVRTGTYDMLPCDSEPKTSA